MTWEMAITGPGLRTWRTERRLTQTKLGERLGGIPKDTISKWERGALQIAHPTILRLALRQLDNEIDDDS